MLAARHSEVPRSVDKCSYSVLVLKLILFHLSSPMQLVLKPKLLLLFTLTFIFFVPIGTLSHEGGHIAVAQMLGYDTELFYGSAKWDQSTLLEMRKAFYDKYASEIKNNTDFPEREDYDKFVQKWGSDSFKITVGGPLETILTSIFGLMILFFRREKQRINGFTLLYLYWLAVFLSLFWLRTTFNVLYSVVRALWAGRTPLVGSISDETRMAAYLDLPSWIFSVSLGLTGLLVALFVVFGVVPQEKRLTFILAGLIGGIVGYVLWLDMLGPILMPVR